MTVKIVTDSTPDIPPYLASELGIHVVPLYVHFGNEVYRDGIDLSPSEFYAKLQAGKALPTTSTISPGEFAQIYDTLAEHTDEILAIVLSAELSATYEAALQGKNLRRNTSCRVEVVDSRLVTIAMGLVVIAAAKQARDGASMDQVLGAVKRDITMVQIRVAFDTLEYLKRGGRIGAAQALVGTLLNVKPILTLKDGVIKPVARERTRAKAIEHLRRFAIGFANVKEAAVAYTTTPEEADSLVLSLDHRLPKEHVYIATVGAVMGTHMGPGALGVAILESA